MVYLLILSDVIFIDYDSLFIIFLGQYFMDTDIYAMYIHVLVCYSRNVERYRP